MIMMHLAARLVSVVFIWLFGYLSNMILMTDLDSWYHPLIMNNKCASFVNDALNNLVYMAFARLFLCLSILTLTINRGHCLVPNVCQLRT